MDFGISAEQVLTARLEIPVPACRESGKRQEFFASVVRETGTLPRVIFAATTTHVPILDRGNTRETRTPEKPAEHTLSPPKTP